MRTPKTLYLVQVRDSRYQPWREHKIVNKHINLEEALWYTGHYGYYLSQNVRVVAYDRRPTKRKGKL